MAGSSLGPFSIEVARCLPCDPGTNTPFLNGNIYKAE
jgi:hypothetical protein